jgi:ribosomal protein L3
MEKNRTKLITGAFIVGTGLIIAPMSNAAEKQIKPVGPDKQRVVKPMNKPAKLELAKVNGMITKRVKENSVRGELLAINGKLGRFKDPEIVGAWGLGCGNSCQGQTKSWRTVSAKQRAQAIQANRKMANEDRKLLLELNASIEKVGKMGPEVVGAWGLGCGNSCARPLDQFGEMKAKRLRR